jgi:protein-tyrosine-phosphatase
MAAAWLNYRYGMRYNGVATGFKIQPLNDVIAGAMKELGVDMGSRKAPTVMELIKAKQHYDHVITLCDPLDPLPFSVYPGNARRVHWRVHDPDRVMGDGYTQMEMIRHIRHRICDLIDGWVFNAEPVMVREPA